MFEENWAVGKGMNTYNYYVTLRGYRVVTKWNPTGIWKYSAHNIYLQVLGESGIIGLLLFGEFLIYNLYHTIMLIIKNNKKRIGNKGVLYFSLYMQILVVVYGITGNPLYSLYQFLLYIIAITILNNQRRKEVE